MAKLKTWRWITPPCTAQLVYVDKPDPGFKGKGGDDQKPKFKITGVFAPGADMSGYEKAALQAISETWPKAKPAAVKSALKDGNEFNDGREEKDKERIALYDGAQYVQGKSAFQPKCFDAKRKPIDPKTIRAGDTVKLCLELLPCDPSGQKTIGVRLSQIQLIAKRAGGGDDAAFGEEEGYEADDAFDGETAGGDDASDGPAASNGPGGGDF